MTPAVVPRDDEDQDMEIAAGMAEAMGAESRALTTTNSSGGTRTMLKETPISIQRHHFGLPETVTKVLTQTSYVTAITGGASSSATRSIQFRLNTPYDWFTTSVATPTTSSAYSFGVWGNPVQPGIQKAWPATLGTYPATLLDKRPQWREYFEKHYAYYTVLGLEYELTLMNPSTIPGDDVVAATFKDSYSSTNATFIHPVGRALRDMEQWPDVNFIRVPAAGDLDTRSAYKTIKGYYRPGSAKTSVENDEDMKTWTKTTAGTLPSLIELMTVSFGKAWDNCVPGANPVMVRMDMRWIVQYKDLKNEYRWPHAGQTAVTVSAPTDILFSP